MVSTAAENLGGGWGEQLALWNGVIARFGSRVDRPPPPAVR